MKSLIAIVFIISISCAGLFYLYSEDGPINNMVKPENINSK